MCSGKNWWAQPPRHRRPKNETQLILWTVFWGFVLLHLRAPVTWHHTPSYKMSKSLIPKNNYWGLKIASADQCNSCRVGIVLVLPFSSTQGLRSPCHLVPRQWVNIHFYPCGFQVTLAGKVYWSFILPEMATKLNHHFLFAQLKNIKCAVLQNSTRTLSLLPLLSSLACIDISCYACWAETALGNTWAVKAIIRA